MVRRVAIVPHTHWDREWYEPFQLFRLRLVELLDELLPRLEADPGAGPFLLDGQMAAVDDYLEARPGEEERIRRLVTSGRLAVGPWYVLMDEFCVSAETIVRDLQLGLERAAELGGAMRVGYLPDMFGHIAQMPQLLRLAGFEHAVVWRGVPAAVDRTAFWWSSPDGSVVRAEHLWVGYGNGVALGTDPGALLDRIRAHEAELGSAGTGGALLDGMLLMNGSDHVVPRPGLARVVAEANASQDGYELVVTSLPDYLDGAPVEGLPAWTGELRSGARSNLLMGVASNRVDVKQAAAQAERALERMAEPLSALFMAPASWPGALLDLAWKEVLRNAAHDSVCACSADEVVDAVLHRYRQARQIGEGLARQALATFARALEGPGVVVVNPSGRARTGTFEISLPAGEMPAGAQAMGLQEPSELELNGRCRDLEALLGGVASRNRRTGSEIVALTVDESELRIEARVTTGLAPGDDSVAPVVAHLYARAGARPDAPIRLLVDEQPPLRVLARARVASLGWTTWAPGAAVEHPVRADGRVIDNGLVRVEVDPALGTFSLNGLAGCDLLVDGGDGGDTYTYSPPPLDGIVAEPSSVEVEVEEAGPVRARLRVTRTFRWPERIVEGRRQGDRGVAVVTVLELHAGEELVRITATLDNPCSDHRLRAHFPLPERARWSSAECAFAVVERGLKAEGGPHERALPTFPSRRFVSAGGLTLVHEGLLEYELVDDGSVLAVTLLRATGLLSRDGIAYRPRPAGPELVVEGAQMRGRHTFRYGVHVGGTDPYDLVDAAFLPLEALLAPGGGHLLSSGSMLAVEGAEVSAVRRHRGRLEVRVFNPSGRETTVTVGGGGAGGGGGGADLVDLLGERRGRVEGAFALGPWGIATLLPDEEDADEDDADEDDADEDDAPAGGSQPGGS